MNKINLHPSQDANFVWEANSSEVELKDASVLQELFEQKLIITHSVGRVTIQAPDLATQRRLEEFMDAAILFHKRRVKPSDRK